MKIKEKIGVIGAGFVGSSVKFGFSPQTNCDAEVLVNDKKEEGAAYDVQNNAALYNMLPRWVIDEDVVSRLDEMLRAVITIGTGRAANPGLPAAGKTGTSQGFRDAWFVGYTDQLVTGIWMGNDDSSPMKRVTGGGYPAQLWGSYTRSALQGRSVTSQLTPPEAVPALGRGVGSSLFERLKRSVRASTDYLEKRANTD